MSPEKIAFLIAVSVVGLIILVILIVKFPKRLKRKKFKKKWLFVMKRLKDKAEWAQSIVEADDLLNNALKKKGYKGKTTGERMVAAQKKFTDNDAVWFGHKLRKKIDVEPEIKLKKNDVKKALLGLRQALRDLGALE